ncbi:MAG: transcriptional repressor [Candidatus Thiodiazotropha sp. (ex Lucina aurantia)]|uniref:Zinc uptake regulation protein n=2 Tax=Candidatus Thiodiazotropha TaxID=1913444 RepID=A0A7Z1AEY4_9GAMM|nr:Fur family transcriptional regulator [Candidatus Thiodiazotropha endolucinida]MBT3011187.1 transcriptional repressor [Candidatus Thiodiazotropha sp. (ex Lucina pensylvanica)]MBT3015506.1 transcriptional repressor [Candidatus Thiodiazotropha taylori]MBT3040285.1 transcriptional repressor [Candidatus Thiodiazotropha sp. (ex Codakia orbicularis)]MBV2103129.1 transcriptional repressor [Candidatus Thiodiazotropha sp. (ex Lucina aurantia)]MBT3023352.1 transcriptional repressor [Candidatus Thiodia
MSLPKQHQQFPTADHDHQHCVERALDEAKNYCRKRGVRLTKLRHRVLELIWANHRPVGAYDLLQQLTLDGHKAAPPTVYRSLDFLLENGLIHRINSLNAFVGCDHPGLDHSAQFFICHRCGQAAELEDTKIESAIADHAKRIGFSIERRSIEITGVCTHCMGECRNA